MSQFKVGDVCITHSLTSWAELNGMECTIRGIMGQGELLDIRSMTFGSGFWYQAEFQDGQIRTVRGVNLRKKQPPRREIDTVVSWEDCAWQPNKVPASIEDMRETV